MNLKITAKYLANLTPVLLVVACASNPNKAEKLDTKIEKSEAVGGDERIGVKDGNMVFQKKVNMSEEVRRLQIEVYSLEYRVYGNRQYGSVGLYGVLKDCRSQVTDKAYGGDGKMIWTEAIDRVTEKDEEFKIGLDENEKLVGIKEEYLKDRITKLNGFKATLEKRQDEYEEKVAICKMDLKSRQQTLNTHDEKAVR
jgi:hypothetical protein